MSDNEESKLDRSITGYNAAISLWKLASQQIYNRFTAMLLANSILFGIAGLAMRERLSFPMILLPILAGCGIALCVVWILFIELGLKWEKYYMEEAQKLEKDAITSSDHSIVPEAGAGHPQFRIYTYIAVGVFVALYSIVLCYSCAM